MDPPEPGDISGLLDPVELPPLAAIRYEPTTPIVEHVESATREAMLDLEPSLPRSGTVAVGVGSRGIHDLQPVTKTVIDELRIRDLTPVIVPAMGSHGGASPAGQRGILEELGITEEAMGCPIDARMETTAIGDTKAGDATVPVHLAQAALEADGILPINRVKPHTDFAGRIESGLCKMLAVGLGKQPGARTVHRHAKRVGYLDVIEPMLEVIRSETPVIGGVAIVENFEHRTGTISGIAADELLTAESRLLEDANDWMARLPVDRIDVLVVDEIGKNVSGTGMDTNVIGRGSGKQFPEPPDIDVVYARSLTHQSKGNAVGMGLADIVHRDLAMQVDSVPTYTNGLTSGNLGNVGLPIVLPTDDQALRAAMAALGSPPPADLRIAWIKNTATLDRMRVSPAVLDVIPSDEIQIERWEELGFDEAGATTFSPTDTSAV